MTIFIKICYLYSHNRFNVVIFNELCLGKVLDSSREEYKRIIKGMKLKGAEGVILGCTEIGMLIKEEDSVLHVFDHVLMLMTP